jgi:hypothetical protein
MGTILQWSARHGKGVGVRVDGVGDRLLYEFETTLSYDETLRFGKVVYQSVVLQEEVYEGYVRKEIHRRGLVHAMGRLLQETRAVFGARV